MDFNLSDYIVDIVDCLHATAPYTEKGHPLIRTTDIQNGRLLLEQTMKVSDETYKTWTQRSIPEEGDLIMAREAPVGAIGIVPKNVKVCLGQRTVQIIPDRDVIHPKYLLYALTHPKTQKLIERYTVGSTVKRINVRDILKLNIPLKLPDLEIQKEIGDKIYLYDEKIQLNQKLEKQLEEHTQLLFRKWFIDFNFPHKDGKAYKDNGGKMVEIDGKLLPVGWNYQTFKGEFDIENGISYTSKTIKEDEGMPMINLGSFSLDGEYLHDKLLYYSGDYQDKKIIRPNDLVVACTDLTRNADIIGQSFLVPETFEDEYLISMDTVCIKIKYNSILTNEFLNYLFKQSHYHEFIKRYANGTNVLHLAKRGLYRYKTFIPNIELIQKFTDIVKIIHKKKSLLMKENLLLSETRDLLIHKLIK